MNYDIITLMESSRSARPQARSTLPDSPVIADYIARTPREPRVASLRKQLATLIWPGQLTVHAIEAPRPAVTSC
jgi:hypothetical protein